MKIKHYRAPDMRAALRQVRDAQGPDAVILSSRRIQGGVEVVAAIDYDADVADGPSESAAGYGLEKTEHARAPQSERSFAYEIAEPAAQASSPAPKGSRAASQHDYAHVADRVRGVQDVALDERADMNEELRTLRRMLETQLATLAWNDLTR